MPELPEVETVRLGLEKYVIGLTIKDVEILHPKPFQGSAEQIIGSKIIGVRRIGKGLIIDLSNGFSLAIHIKLTGQLVFRDEKTKNEPVSPKVGTIPNKFTHVTFHLSRHPEPFGHPERSEESQGKLREGSKDSSVAPQNDKNEEATLYYNDQRRFGWIKVIKTSEVLSLPFFKNMGPEPPRR